MRINIAIFDAQNNIKIAKSNLDFLAFAYKGEYQAGDKIVLTLTDKDHPEQYVPGYVLATLEDSIGPALLYLSTGKFEFVIPTGDQKRVYSEKSFTGGMHYFRASTVSDAELTNYRNLAYNPYQQDITEEQHVYPQVTCPFVAGNIRFAARNLINGVAETNAHGSYPFGSWSTASKADATVTFDFGEPVQVDKLVVHLRADFPHDNYIASIELVVDQDDSNTKILEFTRTGQPQTIALHNLVCQKLTLRNPVNGADKSPFTAISEVEVFGRRKF